VSFRYNIINRKREPTMRSLRVFAGIVVFAALSSQARADDPRCNAPPYGGTVAKFQAFVQNFGALVVPTKILPAICNAKFGGADRTGLYNLGFTDQDIDSKDTEDLGVQMIIALKNLADKTK
jgi:hypothetical protein